MSTDSRVLGSSRASPGEQSWSPSLERLLQGVHGGVWFHLSSIDLYDFRGCGTGLFSGSSRRYFVQRAGVMGLLFGKGRFGKGVTKNVEK